MSTVLIFIILIIVFVVGKFIYESYLTDKTEKNWQRYKKENPEYVAKVEYQDNRRAYSQEVKEKQEDLTGNMKKRFPNFYNFCYQQRHLLKMEFCKDDGLTLEFKMPILTYSRIMGFNYIGITDHFGEYYIYMNTISRSGFRIKGKRIRIYNDQTFEAYNENVNELSQYLMSREEYLQIATGQIA